MAQNKVPISLYQDLLNAALENKPITIYGDGQQTRTFCYIDDHLGSYCKLPVDKQKYIDDVVNIGNDHEISVLELARAIKKITQSRSEIVHLAAISRGRYDTATT